MKKRNIDIWIVAQIILFLSYVVILLSRITHSGLWFDEAVEYFVSKGNNGTAPDGYATGMQELILGTYQPPLYNWVMHIWLLIFEGEIGFRLSGIVFTIIGGIGFALTLSELTDKKYALFGTATYLFSFAIMDYALECAEYCLVLCCLCWVLYFYIKTIKQGLNKHMIGFFIFACLSVYSQYGAVFIVVPLFIHILTVRVKNHKINKCFVLAVSITVIVAALLLFVYLFPQMKMQGSISADHSFNLENGNIFKDLFYSLYKQVRFNIGVTMRNRYFLFVLAMLTVSVASIFIKKDTPQRIILVSAICWGLYYIATGFSIYGYKSWETDSLGTNNIGYRYGLILIPIMTLCVYWSFYKFNMEGEGKPKKISRWASYTICIATTVFVSFYGLKAFYVNGIKDDIREVTEKWYERGAYSSTTFVHDWSGDTFQFYLRHNDNYSPDYQDSIVTFDYEGIVDDKDIVYTYLCNEGFFKENEFYFVCPKHKYAESYDIFIECIQEENYIYDILYEGISTLLYVYK